MTIANLNSNLNSYMTNFLKSDLEKIQVDLTEFSRLQSLDSIPLAKVNTPREIVDEYIPFKKQKVEVILEERLSQVISPEEIKNLLSLIVKGPRISTDVGQFVDIKV